MARYQVILAYDGTRFSGFQRQAKTRTVQAVVEAALLKLGWQGRAVLAAGRTDAGVHASGQVIAFDLEWSHTPTDMQRALNANLPVDVAVRAVRPVPENFHPRYSASGRRYRYRLFCDEARHPLRERFAWRVWPAVALEAMRSSALSLLGTHDFAAFGSPPRPRGSTVRSISHAGWSEEGRDLVFEVVANAFLYHMVRRMVSLQVEIGQGRLEVAAVTRLLENQGASPAPGLAPPHGLSLVEVIYPPEWAAGENNREFMLKDKDGIG
jgi:tRNA pseudouridine38-40 synthase